MITIPVAGSFAEVKAALNVGASNCYAGNFLRAYVASNANYFYDTRTSEIVYLNAPGTVGLSGQFLGRAMYPTTSPIGDYAFIAVGDREYTSGVAYSGGGSPYYRNGEYGFLFGDTIANQYLLTNLRSEYYNLAGVSSGGLVGASLIEDSYRQFGMQSGIGFSVYPAGYDGTVPDFAGVHQYGGWGTAPGYMPILNDPYFGGVAYFPATNKLILQTANVQYELNTNLAPGYMNDLFIDNGALYADGEFGLYSYSVTVTDFIVADVVRLAQSLRNFSRPVSIFGKFKT